jgi:vacuolar protein sorting-associated protein 13A/C
MFESLLNSILEKTLGQYIEGLKKEDLEVSVWSGDVELNNVKIKKDIFQTFGLPLELIYGQIGRLKICVPWKNIGSKPVNVEIENVIIVVSKYPPFSLL